MDDGEGDYLNCPMDEAEYRAFYDALVSAESATVHDFDSVQFFEGCLPIEVMAHRGRETLRFGPMKPVGLPDPRTGRIPFAVVQLRQDTLAGDHFSLVGFQTQLKWGDQARVLRMIPGLKDAEFVRFGMVHRNTYINGPTVLRPTWQTRAREDLFFAGQVSGVEGYVESAGSGLLAGINAAHQALGLSPIEAPRETAIGALAYYVSHAEAKHYQPTNITFGIMPPLEQPLARRSRGEGGPRKKDQRKEALAQRALQALEQLDGAGGDRGARVRNAAGSPSRRPAAPPEREIDADVAAARCHPRLPRSPRAQSQRVRAHRPQLRSGPRAVPLFPRRLHGHAAARVDAGPRLGRCHPWLPRRTARARQQSRLGRATHLRDQELRSIPSSRGRARR